jgi:transcriptional regulator with XRE-family HTH domain
MRSLANSDLARELIAARVRAGLTPAELAERTGLRNQSSPGSIAGRRCRA